MNNEKQMSTIDNYFDNVTTEQLEQDLVDCGYGEIEPMTEAVDLMTTSYKQGQKNMRDLIIALLSGLKDETGNYVDTGDAIKAIESYCGEWGKSVNYEG